MARFFRVNAPAVVSEIIDGEAVIMNLVTGNYFSAPDTGAVIWAWIEQGAGMDQIQHNLSLTFDVSDTELSAALDKFIAELLENMLIVDTGTVSDQHASAFVPASGPRVPFVPPVLGIHTDMQDMLLLDPIDDVDATGWPAAAPAVATETDRAAH